MALTRSRSVFRDAVYGARAPLLGRRLVAPAGDELSLEGLGSQTEIQPPLGDPPNANENDKNRGWLGMVDTVSHLEPGFRMLVCIRELAQVYGSIESQHQKTVLLDFPDHLADRSRYARADALFAHNGVIGKPLRSLQSVQDLEENVQQRLFYVVFEDLMREPLRVLADVLDWLGLPRTEITVDHLNRPQRKLRFRPAHRPCLNLPRLLPRSRAQ